MKPDSRSCFKGMLQGPALVLELSQPGLAYTKCLADSIKVTSIPVGVKYRLPVTEHTPTHTVDEVKVTV